MRSRVEATDKEIAIVVLARMRDDISLYQIVEELEFIAAVRLAISELDENNDSVAIEKFVPKVPAWTVTIGRKRRGRQKRKAGDSLKSPALSPSA